MFGHKDSYIIREPSGPGKCIWRSVLNGGDDHCCLSGREQIFQNLGILSKKSLPPTHHILKPVRAIFLRQTRIVNFSPFPPTEVQERKPKIILGSSVQQGMEPPLRARNKVHRDILSLSSQQDKDFINLQLLKVCKYIFTYLKFIYLF